MKPITHNIADALIVALKSKGFTIQRYNAQSTQSLYLKLDYGLAYSVRISDHKGKKHLKYTFNVIKDYTGKRFIKENGVWRQYYSFLEIDALIESIIRQREWVREKYHPNYAADMEKAKTANHGENGFWSAAVLV